MRCRLLYGFLTFAVAMPMLQRDAAARPLRDVIPQLFRGCVTIGVTQRCEPVQPKGLERFRSLSALLRGGFAPPPLPSASGAFRFAWNPRFDTYARQTESLGPLFAERAATLGRRKAILNVSYSHASFDTFEGQSLHRLEFREPALSAEFLEALPARVDKTPFENDVLHTVASLEVSSDVMFFTGAYGLTDSIDIGAGLTLSRVRVKGEAFAEVRERDDPGAAGDAVFVIEPPAGERFCSVGGSKDQHCVTNSFDEESFGVGDVYLRAKWQFANTELADLATAATLTIPTGGADDFLGFEDPTLTPWLIASKRLGPVSPHVNVGYSFRSGKDVSQARWIAGVEVHADERVTLGIDFLGSHDDNRDGLNDDIVQSAFGIKWNPFGKFVAAGNLQLPVNRDGLRADVIYTLQLEQSF